jgi:hypothetical protein
MAELDTNVAGTKLRGNKNGVRSEKDFANFINSKNVFVSTSTECRKTASPLRIFLRSLLRIRVFEIKNRALGASIGTMLYRSHIFTSFENMPD